MPSCLRLRYLALLCLFLMLTACGGSGGGDDDDGGGESVERPVAQASASASEVNAGEDTVTLDASDSTSPNGSITGYAWGFLSKPENSGAEIEDAESVSARFTPDLPGEYVVRLTVDDGTAQSADTDDARVTVNAVNPNPVAVLPDGPIQWIIGTIQLDGSQSQPPAGVDASQLMYDWTLTRTPEGSNAEIDSGSVIYPRFTADVVGDYQAQLVVSANGRQSEPATVNIEVRNANAAPTVDFTGFDETVTRGDTVELDAAPTMDPDGPDELQYRWRLLRAPDGSGTELSSDRGPKTSFLVDARPSGRNGYRVQLCVFDGISRNCTDKILGNDQIELPDGTTNAAPVADIKPSTSFTYELERGAAATITNGETYDIDGDALSYDWSITSYPDGYDPETDGTLQAIMNYCMILPQYCTNLEFTPSVDGEYVVEIEVTDGQATDTATATFTAMLGGNRPPSAVARTASGTSTTIVGEQIQLDGTESSDADDNRLSYDWVLLQAPNNSSATLQNPTSATPTLRPDVAGPYIARLIVTDELGAESFYQPDSTSHEVVVLAKSSNNPPVSRIQVEYADEINPTAEQPFLIKRSPADEEDGESSNESRVNTFRLTADTYDPDGDPLSHLWTLQSAPAGASRGGFTSGSGGCNGDIQPEQAEAPCQSVAFGPTVAGTYVFNYQIYDGSEFAGPFTTTVHTVGSREAYPGLLLEVFANFAFNTIPGEGRPYQYIPRESHISQSLFPHNETFTGYTGAPQDDIAGELENPITMGQVAYLTASGGDYTFDVDTYSDDARFTPKLMDMTNAQEITDGYVLSQGESIQVMAQVEIPESELSHTSRSQAEALAEALNAAGIRWTLDVEEQPEWRLEYDAEFRAGPVLKPSEVDFGKIWP